MKSFQAEREIIQLLLVKRKVMQRTLLAIMLAATITLAGCTSDSTDDSKEIDNDVDSVPTFPVWSEITDDNTTWSSDKLEGEAYIVIFSAQWCNSPCFNLMHRIWDTQPNIPVMVMSTDNGSEMSFQDWHDSADAYDDEDGETNNNLTSFRFMLGDEEGQELGITSPGTTIFVNKEGVMSWKGKSSEANDEDTINEQWAIANE
jgi:hypothetical protein